MKLYIQKVSEWITNHKDTVTKFLLAILFVIGFWWKSPTIIIFGFLILIVTFYAGFDNVKRAAAEMLLFWLTKWGASPKTTDDIFRSIVREEAVYLPPPKPQDKPSETFQKVELKITTESHEFLKQARDALVNGNIDESINYLKLAIEKDNQNWRAAQMLGALYLNYKDDAEESLKFSLRAIELDEVHFNQFMNAGVAYIWLNKWDEAIKKLKVAIERIEGDSIVRHLPDFVMEYGKCLMFIGEALEKQGQKEELIKYVEQAIEKFEEIPTQYRNDRIWFWIKEAGKRLEELKRSITMDG